MEDLVAMQVQLLQRCQVISSIYLLEPVVSKLKFSNWLSPVNVFLPIATILVLFRNRLLTLVRPMNDGFTKFLKLFPSR